MPDREKVIAWLADTELYYRENGKTEDDLYQSKMANDAIELLKDQEAVEPKKVKGYNPPMYTIYEYECEECESPIMIKQPYCMGCGRKVDWDD